MKSGLLEFSRDEIEHVLKRLAYCMFVLMALMHALPVDAAENEFQDNIWLGKSKDWSAANNWSSGKAPAANDKCNVLIPAKSGNFPEIKGEGVVDGILTIEKGARLSIAKIDKVNGSLSVWNSSPTAKAGLVNQGELAVEAGSTVTVGRGGFISDGTVKGEPRLVFRHPYYNAELKAGKAVFSELVLGEANISYDVKLRDSAFISGGLLIKGGVLVVDKEAVLAVKGDLSFSGSGKDTAALSVLGRVEVHGNVTGNESATCKGGDASSDGWVVVAGEKGKDQKIQGGGGILPPIRIAPSESVVRLDGDLACAGLMIDKGGTLDVTAAKQIQFGGKGPASGWARGFINNGTVKGHPALMFSWGCFSAALQTGGVPLSSLTVDTGNYAYSVALKGDLEIDGSLTAKTGALNLGDNTVTIRGSCYFPVCHEGDKQPTVCLRTGPKNNFVFTGPAPAVLQAGSPETYLGYDTCLQNLVIDKPAGTFKVTKSPLVVNGELKVKNDLSFADGGELWLGVVRQNNGGRSTIADVGLKIRTPLNSENMPEITPAPVPEFVPGTVRSIDNVVGPKLDPVQKLINIAHYAEIRTFPYTTMVRNFVDQDEKLRTMSVPEMLGENNSHGVKCRYEFHFEKQQTISQIRWCVPGGAWALVADTSGKGVYDKLLRMDMEGKISNPDGTWKSRAWVTNNFQPSVKAYGIQLVCLKGGPSIYDFQILVPEDTAQVPPTVKETAGVATIETGDVLEVPVPPFEKQFMKGFHIEPWMFGMQGWLPMAKEKRPPLAQYKGFLDFVQAVKKVHGNIVNMWPPKDFNKARGKGTYEHDQLWPSQYDKWSIDENVLEMTAKAFQDNGIKFFVMDRCPYPKELEEFPKTDEVDKPGQIVSRRTREYLKGIVLEEVKSGVDGVGIGFDEQMGCYYLDSKNPGVKEAFEQKHKLKVPEKAEDSEPFRRWLMFSYEGFASYLGDAASAAKKVNPKILTKCPVHTCLGNLWNRRQDFNIAEDILSHTADLDLMRSSCYECFENIGHYVSAASTKRIAGANKGKGAVSLHNCPWANDPQKFPGYYLHFPPVYMNGSPVSAVMHGASVPLYWRQNFIYYGGYDKYVEQAFSILDTFAAWGGKEAQVPKQILMLKSRASEDWWQVRQRYNSEGKILDQAKGYLYEKWLMEFLLSNGYQFQVRYLEYPQDYEKDLASCDLVILPFPYSVSQKAFQAISSAADKGAKVLLFDRQGETDEWGNAYKAPLFSSMISSGKAVFIKDDVTNVGHYPKFNAGMKDTIEKLLGSRKLFSFNSYGNDVESICLEKGPAEKFVCLINWTDRPLSVDAGLLLPDKGSYEVLQRDLTEVRKVSIGGKAALSAKDLQIFRVPLKEWEIKLLYVKQAAGQ